MILKKHIPNFPLYQYIDSIQYIEGNNKGIGFPKANMSLVFNLNDSFKLFENDAFKKYIEFKKYWLAGFQTKPTYVESFGTSKMFVVQFKTLGTSAFIKEPLSNFANQFISLENIFGTNIEDIWQQLHANDNLQERFKIIENFLLFQLKNNYFKKSNHIHFIVEKCKQGNVRINELADELNLSRKHINNIFKEQIGLSPKTIYSLFRLQTTFKNLTLENNISLTSLAYELEYNDQSHFIHDFKKFTNLSPLAYKKTMLINPSMKIVPHYIPIL